MKQLAGGRLARKIPSREKIDRKKDKAGKNLREKDRQGKYQWGKDRRGNDWRGKYLAPLSHIHPLTPVHGYRLQSANGP